MNDSTDREKLQLLQSRLKADLEASNQRLRKVLQSNSMGIWEWSFAEQRLIWDDQMHKIYGVSPGDFCGTYDDWSKCLHPDDFNRVTTEDLCRDESSIPEPTEFRIVRPDGEVRHIYANVYFETEKSEHGDVTVAVGINVDITERRRAELALVASENKFQRIAEHIPGMVYRYIVYPDGRDELVYASSGSRDIFELEPNKTIESLDIWERIHEDDRDWVAKEIAASTEKMEPFLAVYRLKLPKGIRWVQAFSQPIRGENGEVIWDGVLLDITHRKQAELQLLMANEELARATKMKDEFLANMSHELRTPLNAILGMTEGLQEGFFGPVTEGQLDSFDVIQQSGAHLLELINDVLDLAKIESGSVDLNLTSINAANLCASSLQLVRQQAEKKRIQLNLNVPFNLAEFEGDERRLRQVLLNLLSNAVKFTPDGGQVTLEVQRLDTENQANDNSISFSVLDTGIGIEPKDIGMLFDPFVQVDSALNRKYTGTGLGLSLVKQFVELHAGTVSVTSELGTGSCFIVELPFRPAQLAQRSQNSADHRVPPSSEPTNPPSTLKSPNSRSDSNFHSSSDSSDTKVMPFVLLAEDNEHVARATVRYLESSDFRVELVSNGREAIDASRNQLFDVILMDIQMPGVDGLEAIQKIRQLPQHKETPIISLTGLAMQSDIERCLAAGADDYLSKPYSIKQLIDLIQKYL